MNNTKTLTAIAAILIAATLVVGGTFAATSAFAYVKKGSQDNKKGARDNGSGNGNGNTITVEKCKNIGSASGFDTAVDQECENLICTHPGENATCVQEGASAVQQGNQTTPVKLTCEQCFKKFLSSTGITILLASEGFTSLEQLCACLLYTSDAADE